MKDWREPPKDEERPVAPLWEKLERVERVALSVVEDEAGDAGFTLVGLIVGWIAVLHRRVVSAERWNRRAKRKREMLGSKALRMNMVDRLGGVEALERWEERARLALSFSSQADGSRLRGNDEEGGLEDVKPKPSAHSSPSSPRRRGSSSGAPEFALARMPGRGVRKVKTRIVRTAPKYETPIPVWPCEVMPGRFKKEWWKTEPSETKRKDSKVPEGRQDYPGSPSKRGGGVDDGGPGFNPGNCVAPGLV